MIFKRPARLQVFALFLSIVVLAIAVYFPAAPTTNAANRGGDGWPPLPAVVQGLAGPITVKITVGLEDEEGAELWGSWEQNTRLIEIDSEASPEFRWHTLGHELCHATLGDSGHEYLLEEKQIEALCDALATSRMAEMRGALNLP